MSLFPGNLLSGDIWSTGVFSFESPLKDLLDSEDYTLEQLLAEDELLQELRGLHPKLIDFLSTEASVTQLVHYVVDPKPIAMGMGGRAAANVTLTNVDQANDSINLLLPKDPSTWLAEKGSSDDPEMLYIRYPFMACEIFCCEIDSIIDLLVDGFTQTTTDDHESSTSSDNSKIRILDLLFSLLSETSVGALDDYRAGYFEKLLRVLFKKRPESMTEYLRQRKDEMIPALLQHLYCHSIMQIAQRLLMPHKPTPKKNVVRDATEEFSSSDNDECLLTPPEDGEDDNLVTSSEIQCDWSTSEQALTILLDSLVGIESPGEGETAACLSEDEMQQLLDLSLNAAEVLITIVQNSMLASPQMLRLTSSSVLERLIMAATVCRPDPDVFSRHDSLLTSSMSVLESLILQLGGYGAVGTMSLVEETPQQVQDELAGDDLRAEATDQVESDACIDDGATQIISNLSNMIDLLPLLLDNLAELLNHPSCAEWKSPTQYNKEPQPMLGGPRLRVVRVLEALVLLGDPDVDQRLVQSDCLEICLDFFWEYQWCSMLHQSVANLLVHVFEGGNARVDMQEYFLIRCNILVRLMDSFQELIQENGQVSPTAEVVMNMDDMVSESDNAEREGGDNEPLPISEDDVDAAIEQEADYHKKALAGQLSTEFESEEISRMSNEAVHHESRCSQSIDVDCAAVPAQSFRYGYMGHVIIICQALVHGSTHAYMEDDDQTGQSEDGTRSTRSTDRLSGIKRSTSSVVSKNTNDSVSVSRCDEESLEKEPHFLAEMVKCHPLSDRWEEFVNTTLASETAVQSTPLGGYSGPGVETRRPGLADDGEIMGYDGQPSLPSRRLGELDMDDNDLDVAANMMAGLDMGRDQIDDDDDLSGSGDSNRSYNSGETNHSGGYLFDDPLGKDTTGLGIELEKLTKFKSDINARKSLVDDGESSSSSDESPEDDAEAPVMDLFAGNFNSEQEDSQVPASETTEFDFANFDDAFAKTSDDMDEEFGAFVEAPTSTDKIVEDIFEAHTNSPLLESNDDPESNGVAPQESASCDVTTGSPTDEGVVDQVKAFPTDDSLEVMEDSLLGDAIGDDKAASGEDEKTCGPEKRMSGMEIVAEAYPVTDDVNVT